ncbi:MAG: triphosphoribosyl-dephospho-CoA synthase [Candidatus Bruticola sp.]
MNNNSDNLSSYVADLALEALLLEVTATPKPGLVDRRNCGAHGDMNFYTFIASAMSLRPHFALMVREGINSASLTPPQLFDRIRLLGQTAEKDMFTAAQGANTHKGALFLLGILCAASGRLYSSSAWSGWSPRHLGQMAAQMTSGLCQRELEVLQNRAHSLSSDRPPDTSKPHNGEESNLAQKQLLKSSKPIKAKQTESEPLTHGQRMYLKYGALGARGQAESGFMQVISSFLPYMRDLYSQQLSSDEVCVRTLLFICANLDDTNMLKRAGLAKTRQVQAACAELSCCYSYEAACRLDDLLIKENISPGGSADLLSVTIFLDKLCH